MKKIIYSLAIVLLTLFVVSIFKTDALANELKTIYIKQSSLNPNPIKEHHFIITGVLNLTAPATITVVSSDNQQHVLPLAQVTGDAAHYGIVFSTNMTIINGWTSIDQSWSGQFVESWEPTAVTLLYFRGTRNLKGIKLQWATADEINNLGFNLYRSGTKIGKYQLLNKTIIPTKNAPGSTLGATYGWLDMYAQRYPTYWYILEDVEMTGISKFHGPIEVANTTSSYKPTLGL